MDPRFLEYYERELQYIRESGGEFAREFPKIAGRLGLDSFACADPYVERLLEGFAYLAARVQLKVDAEFPRFSQRLLEMVYPHCLAPLPSMVVVQMQPDLNDGSLMNGFFVPRDTALRSRIAEGEQTACEYRTSHNLTLWPLALIEAEYLPSASSVVGAGSISCAGLKAGLRLRLQCSSGLNFNQLPLDRLTVFLRGGNIAAGLYEQLFSNLLQVVVQPAEAQAKTTPVVLPANIVKRSGFANEQALLPYNLRSFSGYRLLQEYFAFPERFMFVELTSLQTALVRCEADTLDLFFQFNHSNKHLAEGVNLSHFSLFCTPAINLFPKRADRIHLTSRTTDNHIIPDRTRPADFEVYSVTEVVGFGGQADPEMEFLSFYQTSDRRGLDPRQAYYALYREPRRTATNRRKLKRSARAGYVGTEAFLSLVDSREAPYPSSLKQLGVMTLCTNRDLPISLPLGGGQGDFTILSGGPVDAVRCLVGPSRPKPSNAMQNVSWQLISHLSLNYLSLSDNDAEEGAAALRQLLMLYGDRSDAHIQRQIQGLRSISTKPVIRRIVPFGKTNRPVPISFGRGLEVIIEFEEAAFEGSGVFLLGAVLENFFSRYVSLNSFTETVIKTIERGEIKRWPTRMGNRNLV